jgi:hypothetical protein
VASSESALKITLALASVTGLRVPEQVLRIWTWLPVRGRVGVTLLAAFAVYWAWRAVAAWVLRPRALQRRDVVSTVDRRRTIEPALREPIDPEVGTRLGQVEEALGALGFSAPQRTTASLTFPIAAVDSLLEHPARGDLATVAVSRIGAGSAAATLSVALTFESQLADGTRLVTTTSDQPTPWPPRKKTSTTRLPPGTPAADAYTAHRALVVAEARRSRQTPLTRGATPDQRLVYAKRETLHLHRHLVACGHRTKTPEGLRLTFRGALAEVRAGGG